MTQGAVSTVGALLPCELLGRVRDNDPQLSGLGPTDFGLVSSERPRDAITRSWHRLSGIWPSFKNAEQELSGSNGPITSLTRRDWLLPLLEELGFAGPDAVGGLAPADDTKRYAISHEWRGRVPLHLMGWRTPIDRLTPGLPGAAKASPHGLLQEFLNRSDAHLWGIVSNGKVLRLLRDNASLTRQAYVEFDLAQIFDSDSFSDFALLWLCCHRTRFEGATPHSCLLEQWHTEAATQGTRARDKLRSGVQQAIECLGTGVLKHRANTALRARLRTGELTSDELQRQLLRVIYRMLFLLVAESRDLLASPEATDTAQDRYRLSYSMQRLRDLSRKRRVGAHSDLWQGLNTTMAALDVGHDTIQQAARNALGLAPLGSLLWSQSQTSNLNSARIDNTHLLAAVRSLTFVHDDDAKGLRPVDYQNLGTEELGSVYESLLELHAVADPDTRTFTFAVAAGSERKTTGSYYTPPELISRLLDSALDPVIKQAASQPDPQQALLSLRVLDPACGSGHFLIAAAHRIANKVAKLREAGAEPSPQASREALRDVVGRCVHGIDLNPMAVELCKVSLWLESNAPGRPLSFLDHRIICGNSLLGTTPNRLADGIPDTAFKPLTGDDPEHTKLLRKRNKDERKHLHHGVLSTWSPASDVAYLTEALRQIDASPADTAEQVAAKQAAHDRLQVDAPAIKANLIADAWCAAFAARKTADTPGITDRTLRRLQQMPPEQIASLIDDALDVQAPVGDAFSLHEVVRAVRGLADEHRFNHLHLAFPEVFEVPDSPELATNQTTGWSGGFDVIVGNPPWERVKLQEKEFFAQHDEAIATAPNAATRKRLIAELKTSNPTLRAAFETALRHAEGISSLLRNSGSFPLTGRGDVNTYAVFVELMANGLAPTGRVGVIVPTGIATDDTTKHLFGHLVDNSRLVSLYDFENRKGIFPAVDSRMKFCLLSLTGAGSPASQADFAFFAQAPSDLDDSERRFTLTPEDFAILNPNTKTCPIFRTVRDAEITKAIYCRLPVLVNETDTDGNPWGVSFQSMFHMTNDSGLFRDREWLEDRGYVLEGNRFVSQRPETHRDGGLGGPTRYLPLYEAKMIHNFDHRWATYDDGEFREMTADEKQDPACLPLPRSWIPEQEVAARVDASRPWLIGWRNISNATNMRTWLMSPHSLSAAGNSLQQLVFSDNSKTPKTIIHAAVGSFVSDFVARQKLGGSNLNHFVIRQMPIVAPEMMPHRFVASRVCELSFTSWDMASFAKDLGHEGSPFCWDEERRALMRAELDALMFHLYGVNRQDVDYIMDTFPIVKRQDERQDEAVPPEFRTKLLILERYDAMTAAFEATHGSLNGTPNGTNPPADRSSLATYSRRLAAALDAKYQTVLHPPPAGPSQAHPASTRPDWA